MAALCVNEQLLTVQSGGRLLTYLIGSSKPPFAMKIERPEKQVSDRKGSQQTGTEEGRDQLLVFGISPRGQYLVGCDDYKQMWVWTRDLENGEHCWKLYSKRILPRRSSSLTFTLDESSVVVADKSGDAYRYSLTDTEAEGTLLAGHISMLLDVLLCGGEDNFLVTCDRDEKIRVSHFPNAYNIQSYCLGHTEFVSKLGYFKKEDVLVSGGGDGTLRIWNYMTGKELFQVDLKTEFPLCDQTQANQDPSSVVPMDTSSPDQTLSANEDAAKVKDTPLARSEGVADVKCLACCQKNNYVAVSCDRQNLVLLFILTTDGGSHQLKQKQKILVSGSDVWCLDFDEVGNLWVLQSDSQQVTRVFAYAVDKDEYVPLDSCNGDQFQAMSNIVTDLNTNQQDFFKAAFVQPTSSTPLHKVKIDNVTEYHERKQQKMAEKLSKRKGPKGAHGENADKLKKQKT